MYFSPSFSSTPPSPPPKDEPETGLTASHLMAARQPRRTAAVARWQPLRAVIYVIKGEGGPVNCCVVCIV